jgi:hypothetical protein
MSWTDAYATTRDLYGMTRVVNGKTTNPHRGVDFAVQAGDVVPAYEECIVVESGTEVTKGFTAILGWYVVAKSVRDGRYLGWAHLRRGTRPEIGTRLKPGDQVGLAASGPIAYQNLSPAMAGINYPGTAWSGPHIHTTVSDTIIGIYFGNTWDPLPRIRAALTSLASTNITPITVTPKPIETENDLLPDERAALLHIYNTLTPGIAGTKNDGDGFARIKAIQNALGTVYDTLTPGVQGVKYDGDVLARVKALQTALATVTERQIGYGKRDESQDAILPLILDAVSNAKPLTLSDADIAKIAALIPKPALSIDYAALAKAVNDDAAKRLAQ